MNERELAIQALVKAYGPSAPLTEQPSDSIPLAVPSFGGEEIEAAIDTLLKGWVTMGPKVQAFEQSWAKSVGVSHAIAVNSGSSALLVMLSALVQGGYIPKGTEVAVPAVGWSTSLFSILNAGLNAVLVDVDPDSGRIYCHLLHGERAEATAKHVEELAELACQALPVPDPSEVPS